VTGGAVVKAASAGAARRLVQSTVVFVVVAASSAAVLLGLTLLTSANAGFLAGFAATHGANVAVTVNASKVTAADLARTRHLPGVIDAKGFTIVEARQAPRSMTWPLLHSVATWVSPNALNPTTCPASLMPKA